MEQHLSIDERTYIEQRVQNEKKSAGIAYLLWFFLGGLGGHRFYLGFPFSGIILLLVTLFTGWFTFFIPTAIWVFVDLFLINRLLRNSTEAIRYRVTNEVLANKF